MDGAQDEYEPLKAGEKIEDKKELYEPSPKSKSSGDWFTYLLVIFITVLLYGIANRIFA
jgi:hypothetical protein